MPQEIHNSVKHLRSPRRMKQSSPGLLWLNLGNAAVYLCSHYGAPQNSFRIFMQERNASFLDLLANFCPSPTFLQPRPSLPIIAANRFCSRPTYRECVSSSKSGIWSRYILTVGEAYTSAARNWSVKGSEPPLGIHDGVASASPPE
jgi:hypothetical protein